jgi:hypothetical protein
MPRRDNVIDNVEPAKKSLVNKCLIFCLRLSQQRRAMHTIETADPLEAQRCRRRQYSGGAAALVLNGLRYVGTVLAVKEVQSAGSTRWIVRIAAETKKPTPAHQDPSKRALR